MVTNSNLNGVSIVTKENIKTNEKIKKKYEEEKRRRTKTEEGEKKYRKGI